MLFMSSFVMGDISGLGPVGTYTHTAAMDWGKRTERDLRFVPENSEESAAMKVASGKSDLAIIAYYNYLRGLVLESIDNIYEHNLHIIAAERLSIKIAAGHHPDPIDLSTAYSHSKALAQCSNWVVSDDMKKGETSSTAAAITRVKETRSGIALGRIEELRRQGLEIISDDVTNKRNGRQNYTDFYILSKKDECPEYREDRDFLTMVAITPHYDEIGLLANILNKFKVNGLNNEKIHSRPALDDIPGISVEPQMFYLEIVAHKDDSRFRQTIGIVRNSLRPVPGIKTDTVRVLGSYERPILRE